MSKKYAVDETSVQSSLAKAVAERDLLTLMQMLVPVSEASSDMKPGCFTDAMLKTACEAAGCIAVYERDKALAPLAVASQQVIEEYSAMCTGGQVFSPDDCSLVIFKNEGEENEHFMRISSPIIICGEEQKASGGDACLQVLVKATTGAWVEVFLPRAELVGGGTVIQARLQDCGLRTGDWAALLHLLQNVEPTYGFKRLEHIRGVSPARKTNRFEHPRGDKQFDLHGAYAKARKLGIVS